MTYIKKAILMKFDAPVSLNTIEEEHMISSVTLWGALISAGFKLGVGETLIDASLRGNFIVSSGFPLFEGDEEEIFYIPKPFSWNLFRFSEEDEIDTSVYKLFKSFKKRRLIPAKWLREVRSREMLLSKLKESTDELKRYDIFISEIPKVSLDRVTSSSNLFFWTVAYISNNTYFYFLVRAERELFEEAFLPSLSLLSEEGIGAKKNWGLGYFRFEVRDVPPELCDISDGDTFLALSKFIPSNRANLKLWDIYVIPATYSLVLSKGYNIFRPKLLCYSEGSLLTEEDLGTMLTLRELYSRADTSYPEWAPEIYIFLRPYLLKFKDL